MIILTIYEEEKSEITMLYYKHAKLNFFIVYD